MFHVCSNNVNFGEEDYPIRDAYVGEAPAGSHVDVVLIYCISCGTWLGWTIARIYIFHKLIHFRFDLSIC